MYMFLLCVYEIFAGGNVCIARDFRGRKPGLVYRCVYICFPIYRSMCLYLTSDSVYLCVHTGLTQKISAGRRRVCVYLCVHHVYISVLGLFVSVRACRTEEADGPVATISRLHKIIGLFCRMHSLL